MAKLVLIACILRKMIVMHLDVGPGFTKGFGYNILAEAAIDEEGDFRQP